MPWSACSHNAWRPSGRFLSWKGGCAWVLPVLLFLVPVWLFRYLPTQDGPAHLANALIVKGYGQPGNRFQEFYWIAWQPLPNWTCFALLAGFASVLPPLLAEKLLVSLYLLGFALSYRYFLKSLEQSSSALALAGFLLAFNRCFWMGFYNYCLSLVLYFFLMGYLLRCWSRFRAQHAVVLGLLFGAIFFTHLFGFFLAAGSCLWIAGTVAPRRWGKALGLLAALAPATLLALVFFEQARFYGSDGFGRLAEHLSGWLDGTKQWTRIQDDVIALGPRTFGVNFPGPIGIGTAVLLLYLAFVLLGFEEAGKTNDEHKTKRRSIAFLGLTIALLYFVVPDFLVFGKGGYWKARLALLSPLLWLSCVPTSSVKSVRYALTVGTLCVLAVQLSLVTSFLHNANRVLSEFTAGIDAAGQDQAVFFRMLYANKGLVNPLEHAADYYCLDSHNINVSHHFAKLLHSPVRLRSGIEEGTGDFEDYGNASMVDVIIMWNELDPDPEAPPGFGTVFHQGCLKIMRRTGGRR